MTTAPDAHRSAGRPRTAVLSRERILAAAFALADVRGGDFTLAALARSLGVRPSALHHYFAGKDELIAGMRGQLTSRVGDHGFDTLPWHEAIIPWARTYRVTFGAHPGIVAALATLPVADEPESMLDYERIARAMHRDGYPEHRIVPAIVALESFIIGSALDSLTPEDNLRPVSAPDRTPHLTSAEEAARAQLRTHDRSAATETFEFGLAALVAGLRAAGTAATVSGPTESGV
ncbi:TetR family transcriptional regulator [Leucobacter luti]|uniref:TetR family transcriptional regulator n=1 Tax=Leucobacter luti TaxID=340320 RepID=A0A4V3CX72_9MICO|nr:TetR/AcrR family transcriptional regulator [Leucobacter luti]MCW2289483.1 AcrR family transcriptional regulator [Leucobacter luti]TCK33906.1 TetR family transcriptional regulator [Leucobacter luti]TDP89128.1 TetR family transcriptional regulator [Leucobacter luti]